MAVAPPAAEELSRDLSPSAADLISQAHFLSISMPPAQVAQRMRDLFGLNLSALMAGVEHPKTVGRWIHGQEPHPANLARLRTAYQIAALLQLATSEETVFAWFTGMNPVLDDRSPAMVLIEEPEQAPQVMRAARGFLAHG